MSTLTLSGVLKKLYGVNTYVRKNPLTTTVLTTPTQILPGNPNRLSGVIVNLGANPIYVGLENTVSSTEGIYLVSNGGNLSFSFETDFELVSNPWFAIASGGNSTVYVIENNSLGGGEKPV